MLQYHRLWSRLLTCPLLGGHSHALCQPTPEIKTYRRGAHLAATAVAVALRSCRAGTAGQDSAALSQRRHGFGDRRCPPYQSTPSRALDCQGSGAGRTLGVAGSAGPGPSADVEPLIPGMGGGAGLQDSPGVVLCAIVGGL